MLRRYHITLGAKTTAGGVVATASTMASINGATMVIEGDMVDCPACKTQGVIQVVPPRIPDRFNGKEFALDGDLCICQCNPPPKLLASQQFKCQTMVVASEESAEEAAARANGRNQDIHGMATSGGGPLYSMLNDIDGVGNQSGDTATTEYFLNANGQWAPVKAPEPHEDPYDEQLQLTSPPIEGVPYYVETMDGRTFSGRNGADGLLPRIDTYGEDEYQVYWGDAALAKMERVEP